MIDFHCHLDLYPNPQAVIRQAHEDRLFVLGVTTTPKAWRKSQALTEGYDRIRTALGLHPEIAHERISELELFETLLPQATYVGEIGLDGGKHVRDHASIQQKAFSSILRFVGQQGGRVATIHSRGAVSSTLEILRSYREGVEPVLHWFTGSRAQALAAIDMGCWFSVGPPMLGSKSGRELIALMPRNRVLTETDGPFGQVGGRPLMPSDSRIAVAGLAALWKAPQSEVESILRRNLKDITSRFPKRK